MVHDLWCSVVVDRLLNGLFLGTAKEHDNSDGIIKNDIDSDLKHICLISCAGNFIIQLIIMSSINYLLLLLLCKSISVVWGIFQRFRAGWYYAGKNIYYFLWQGVHILQLHILWLQKCPLNIIIWLIYIHVTWTGELSQLLEKQFSSS